MKISFFNKILRYSFFLWIILLLVLPYYNFAQNKELVCWWKFDNEEKVLDTATQIEDDLEGNYEYVKGISGQALKFDGFTTKIIRQAKNAPSLEKGFSIECWVALAAYPWNWIPLVSQKKNDNSKGYYFGIGPQGHITLQLAINSEWKVLKSEKEIPLRKWTYVAGSYNPEKQKVVFYLDGRLAGEFPVRGSLQFAPEEKILIGMNSQKITPSHPVRPFGTLPAWYSLDGILDELKIYNRDLDLNKIQRTFKNYNPSSPPEILPRKMPSGPEGPGRFGAYYTKLNYYPAWDNLWRTGPYSDIVVQFDNSPVRVVFWRGTRYSPVWVMENGLWMADQSAESFNNQEGCFEHMLDAHCRYSNVKIIENHEARVVVQWSYIPVSSRQHFSQVKEKTDWVDRVEEYYTFYPDGTGMRKVVMWTSGHPLGPQEAIVLCHPGQRPEDVINLDALTLINLEGKSHVYSWAGETPDFQKEAKPKNPVIQVINLKSKFKPFMIFEPDCQMKVFGIEHRKGISHFPWWNHWPVAQIPSDGRYAQAPDRASHFSLSWGGPPIHEGPGITYWASWMYGATQKNHKELAQLAKSWVQPPELVIKGNDFSSKGFDLSQRAYKIQTERSASSLKMELSASKESPVVNPCFYIKEWGEKRAAVRINGKKIKNVRFGYVKNLGGKNDLVVWIEKKAVSPLKITIVPEEK